MNAKKTNTGKNPAEHWVRLGREALDIEIEGLRTVQKKLGPAFAEAVAMLAACTGRVIVSGIGKSGLVGRKLAATFSSTGTPSFFLHPVEGQHGDLGSVRADDVLIAISNSGRTDELNAILPPLRGLGLKIIALTGGQDSPLAGLSDVVINTAVPREACPMNLAPTTSTTAVLAVGDALAVCLIHWKSFTEKDFQRFHPGGTLGQRLALPVREIMHTEKLPLSSQDASSAQALEILHQGGLGTVLLLDAQGAAAGILTDGDVRRAVIRGALKPAEPIHSIMTRNFLTADPDQSVAQVLDLMESRAITVLPVLDARKKPLGLIHLHDLLGKGRLKFANR